MIKEEFINSKIKLSKKDIIEDYYKTEEKLIKNIDIEHKNYELQKENEQLSRDVDMWNKKYNDLFDKWTELRDWLEENWEESQDIWFVKIINKMREISEGDE